MYIVLAAGAVIYGCLMLAWRRPPLRSWIPRVSRERLREAGLLTALVTLALCAVALATNANPWPAMVVVPATGLLIACAPPSARKLIPIALVALGLLGLLLAGKYSAWATGPGRAVGQARATGPGGRRDGACCCRQWPRRRACSSTSTSATPRGSPRWGSRPSGCSPSCWSPWWRRTWRRPG